MRFAKDRKSSDKNNASFKGTHDTSHLNGNYYHVPEVSNVNGISQMNNTTHFNSLQHDNRWSLGGSVNIDSSNFSDEVLSLTNQLVTEQSNNNEASSQNQMIQNESSQPSNQSTHGNVSRDHHEVTNVICDENNNRFLPSINVSQSCLVDGKHEERYSVSSTREEIIESSIVIEEITIIEEQQEIIDEHGNVVETDNENDNEKGFTIVKENHHIESDSLELTKRDYENNYLSPITPQKKGPKVIDLQIETNVDYKTKRQRHNSSATSTSDDVFYASEIDSPGLKTPTYGNKKHYVFLSQDLHDTSSVSDESCVESRASISLLEEIKEIESNLLVDLNAEEIVAKEEILETSIREKEQINKSKQTSSENLHDRNQQKSVDLIPITPKTKKRRSFRNYLFCGVVKDESKSK